MYASGLKRKKKEYVNIYVPGRIAALQVRYTHLEILLLVLVIT